MIKEGVNMLYNVQTEDEGSLKRLWALADSSEGQKDYLVNNKLIINHEEKNFLAELKKGLNECEKFYMSVAFINFSGLQLLLDTFKELEERGIRGKILTSTYLNFTEPKALERIKQFSNIDLKVFVATKEIGFHTKAYIFESKDSYKIIVGSSNITQRALKSNIEWNVRVISKKEDAFANEVVEEYLKLWERTRIVDEAFLEKYEAMLKKIKRAEKVNYIDFEDYELIKPNEMQTRAIDNLRRLRISGENKAIVIAATGTGKTYMSAFDVMAYKPQTMLFLVHREEILKEAERTYRKLTCNKTKTMGIFTGSQKDRNVDYLFATIQSMNNSYESFSEDAFEYIILDEAHHAASPTYQKVLAHFKPKFLLGMTATPERCDSENIFEIFDHNVALEVRLHEALDLELVIPFHYFGVTDIEGIDLSDVKADDVKEIVRCLKVNERVDFIVDKMNFYGFDGDKRKAIGFCASIDHAEYMTREFNKKGIASLCLTGENTPEQRINGIKRLESDVDPLEVIFTVDILNEGVDIPSINLVLMLRPTNSPIIFIQQLGRGLRKHQDKSFLTVLDFIGNHKKAFLIAIALNGERYYDKDSLKVAVATEFGDIPGCTHIQMDRIAQERILEQLNTENFNSMKYLRDEYQEFKKMNSGRVPYILMDYMKYDGAPDPVRFIDKEKTYLGFVAKMEKDEVLERLLENETFAKILKEISARIPLKRPHEFAIFRAMMRRSRLSAVQAKTEIEKYIESARLSTTKHALSVLAQAYYDTGQIKTNIRCFNYEECEEGNLTRTVALEEVLNDNRYRIYIEDVINYGLIRYEKEFGIVDYGMPFFKIYEQYQMIDTALLSNYTKIHSSFRGSGLITNDNDYFLFIDLHKDEDIKKSINYQDMFINPKHFQWQSPNATTQGSERGKNIIFNKERGINLHLFIRKYKQIDGSVQPYIYIGHGDVIQYEGEKPITVLMKLHLEVPAGLYTEFTKKV
jgi:superfamily II DNA or RNA helicase